MVIIVIFGTSLGHSEENVSLTVHSIDCAKTTRLYILKKIIIDISNCSTSFYRCNVCVTIVVLLVLIFLLLSYFKLDMCYYLFQQACHVCLMLSAHVGVHAVHSDLWLLGSYCVYLQSHDLRMTPTGLNKEGREGQRGSQTVEHIYTLNVLSCHKAGCTLTFWYCVVFVDARKKIVYIHKKTHAHF